MKRILLSLLLFVSLAFLCVGCEDNPSSTPPQTEYTVTFYSDASTVFTSVKVKDDERVTKPENEPSITGKGKFKNWVTDLKNEDGTIYDFSKEVKGNINLYASYYALKTVTLYKSDGKTKLRDVYVSYSSPLEKPSDDYIDGCLIKKWVTLDGSDYDFSTPLTVDLSLKAECYKAVTDQDKKEALAYMKIKDALLSTTGEKSEETIKGFEKETLAAIYLFRSVRSKQNVDIEKNIYPYWPIDGTNYYLYRKGMDSLELSSFLYYEIGDFSCSFYPPTITEEETVIEIDSFSLPITFYKGKYNPETDIVEKDDNGGRSQETILIDKIKIVRKADGSTNMTIIVTDAGYSIEYKEADTETDTTTERTIVVNSGGTEYGLKLSFPTITFDEGNGKNGTVCEVLSGTEVSKPSSVPTAPEGYKLFKEWTLDGKAWDFSTPVDRNITLEAEYWTEAEYNKILKAVCINNITCNLSKCTEFIDGGKSGYVVFDEKEYTYPYLTYSLLSSLFQIDDNWNLYILNNGTKYSYTEKNKDTYIVTPIHADIDISKNQSSKSSDTGTIYVKCSDMTLSAGYARKNEKNSLGTESASFNIDGKIEKKSDGSEVTTSTFSSGGTTYPTVYMTKTTLSNGKTRLKYEYDGMTFYKVY